MTWVNNLKHITKNYRTRGITLKYENGGFGVVSSGNVTMCLYRGLSNVASNGSNLSRDVLAKLWVLDKEMGRQYEIRKMLQCRSRSRSNVNVIGPHFEKDGVPYQPPPTEYLPIASPEEAKIATLLERSNLLITRDIEWANLVLGFEQENRYAMVDVHYPHSPVGFIREQSNLLARQFLRTRRPFVAYVTDGMGNELFQVHRPFWWVTSSIYAVVDGKEIGVVHRRWHLWRRIYDLYVGNKQFAVVENPGLWNWTFTLKDVDGNVLAQIDRDWRGFGFELLTDAGQYVIRFGTSDPENRGLGAQVEELEVDRPLTLSERAVTVALAVSLDNDYFSRHGGWGIPFFVVED